MFLREHVHDRIITQRDLHDELTVSIQFWIANDITDDAVNRSNL
jgi:hypothetical protein